MKLAIVLSTKNIETNWNAFRIANLSITNGDEVVVFLLGEGVEYNNKSSQKYNLSEQIKKFQEEKGKILACTTCLKAHNLESTATCPADSLKTLYSIIKEFDKVLTF